MFELVMSADNHVVLQNPFFGIIAIPKNVAMKLSEAIHTIWKGTSPGARRARQLIKLAVLALLFIATFWVVPIGDVVESLLNADPLYLLLGFVLVFPVGYLRAAQRKLLIRLR